MKGLRNFLPNTKSRSSPRCRATHRIMSTRNAAKAFSIGASQLYDCDFNQQLDMQWLNGRPMFLWNVDPNKIDNREIMTGDHCFGCTAGAGSSCGGALV